MARLLTIGVPWDSSGRDEAVDQAAEELRRRGLVDRLAARHEVRDWGTLFLPEPVAGRGTASGLVDESGFAIMTERLRESVAWSCAEDFTTLVYGADAAVLCGCLAGARDGLAARGLVPGLVFVAAREHAYRLDASPDGRAGGSALRLALAWGGGGEGGGRDAGRVPPAALAARLPLVSPARTAVLGPRDAAELRGAGVESLRAAVGDGLLFLDEGELREEGPAAAGRRAALQVAELPERPAAAGPRSPAAMRRRRGSPWWLHVDLEVLDVTSLSTDGVAPGRGLSWAELGELVGGALGVSGCCGVSLCGYDPAFDPDRRTSRTIVDFVERLAGQLD